LVDVAEDDGEEIGPLGAEFNAAGARFMGHAQAMFLEAEEIAVEVEPSLVVLLGKALELALGMAQDFFQVGGHRGIVAGSADAAIFRAGEARGDFPACSAAERSDNHAMPLLGVNIDHVATLRQARYREEGPDFFASEPDPVEAALESVSGGAYSITAHLREDRRHVQERDVRDLKMRVPAPLNLEMAVTDAMVAFALDLRPAEACLVPENRREVTTEGGLDVAGNLARVRDAVAALQEKKILTSLFIDPDARQIEAAAAAGAKVVELHTGAYARMEKDADRQRELDALCRAAERAHAAGLQVNAGHGLNYRNLPAFLAVPHLHTLNIGHSIVSRAVFFGMRRAVEEMVRLLAKHGHPA
jgi:pyridoxine 5-phosphate synthase